jgi:hypothetical protein
MFDQPILMIAAVITSLVGVPVLLVFAYRAWRRENRASLPQWRNGVGLTALVLAAVAWGWYALGIADMGLTSLSQFMDLTSVATLCAVLAFVFAIAWKGMSRLLAVAATLLIIFGYQFFGYTSLHVRFL